MTTMFNLDVIDGNPYQLRTDVDPMDVEKLADSILKNGLLQTPIGRKVGKRVQLAFGHSRLAAFRLLRERDYEEFHFMAVDVRELSDEQMFELGTEENIKRKNLSPVEEARGMMTYRDHFGKNSAEIGKLFGGLSDSAVRNKIRLLSLPESIQRCLASGEMLEGSARALLRLLDLNELERQAAEDQDAYPKPSEITELARIGTGQKRISELIDSLMAWLRPAEVKPIPGQNLELPLAPAPEPIPPAIDHRRDAEAYASRGAAEGAEEEETASEEEVQQIVDLYIEKPEETTKPMGSEIHPTQTAPQPPAPRPEPIPAAPRGSVSTETAAKPAAAPASRPAQEQKPEPKPVETLVAAPSTPDEPEKRLSWEESTIMLTLTLYPENGDLAGRTVIVGGRINNGAPKMKFWKFYGMGLAPEWMSDILTELKNEVRS